MEKMKSRLFARAGVLAIAMAVLCATGCDGSLFGSSDSNDDWGGGK